MRLITWNINSLVPTVRNFVLTYGSFQGWLREHNLQIACFQEAKVPEAKLTKDVACVEGFESFWAFSRAKLGYSGVTTYASEAWSPVHAEADSLGGGDADFDQEGRALCTDHGAFVVINVYCPNAGDPPKRARLPIKTRFLEALKRKADALAASGREVLIVGDLNVAAERIDVHPRIKPPEVIYAPEERALLAALLDSYPDVWRRLHPEQTGVYTVWDEKTSARIFNEGVRIDYVLASQGLLDKVVSCEVILDLPPKWSDHAAILLELRDVQPPPPHTVCALSSARMKRFNDRSQPSMATLFKKRPAETPPSTRPSKRSASATGYPAVVPAGVGVHSGAEAGTELPAGGQSAAGAASMSEDAQLRTREHARQCAHEQASSPANADAAICSQEAAEPGSQAHAEPGAHAKSAEQETNPPRDNVTRRYSSTAAASKAETKRDKGQRTLHSFFCRPSS